MFLSLLRPKEEHHKDVHNELLMSPVRSLDKPYQEPLNPVTVGSLLKLAACGYFSPERTLKIWPWKWEGGPWDCYDS